MNRIFLTDGKISPVKIGLQIVIIAALVVGLFAFIGNNKTIRINLDGRVSSVQTFGGSVNDAVRSANIDLGAGDQVSPARDSSIDNGAEVTIKRLKDVAVTTDGKLASVKTNAVTVADLRTELKVAPAARVSVPDNTSLEVTGSKVEIATPKNVNLVVRGKASKLTTTALTVADVLKEAKVTLAKNDVVAVPTTSPVTTNMTIKVSNIDKSKTAKVTESIDFDTVKTNSSSLYEGETKVTTEGVKGSREKTYRLVIVDGKEATRTLLSDKVTAAPVTEQVSVGTKVRQPEQPATPANQPQNQTQAQSGNTGAAAPPAANGGMWDRIAQCESSGNWSINTGNGYYGGLQFDIQTWLGAGGGAYAPNAALATKAQQIDIANRVYAQRGLSPWGCGWAAG